ncbi:HMG box-containing protein 4 isoform X2 [Cherax quadricarinatus]
METSPKNKSGEATGVSRSGRVRKKSSKLADFESPDEIDTRFKRKTDRPIKSQKSTKIGQPMGADVYDDSDSYIEDEMIEVKDEPIEVEDWADNDDGDDDMCDDGDDKDDAPDLLHVDDDSTDMPRETTNYSLAQSLYFSEKQGKKNIMLKDGQVVRRKKAQRKDKGKSRFTAYMLWAREIRPGIICANPNMDFSAVNKRLGELWALVPTTQKYNWKRRAKRLAAKGNQKGSMITTGKAAKQSQNAVRSNLINKGGVKPQQVIRTPSKQSEAGQTAPPQTHKAHTTTPKASRSASSAVCNENSPTSAYKVTGSSPIDVAAHIKLLGESLNNIGQKLKEHEGQIAVSGSLSVLLDSMLCVLGPLTCLTAQVSQMQGAVPEPTLMNILDNIAYIMPGIV